MRIVISINHGTVLVFSTVWSDGHMVATYSWRADQNGWLRLRSADLLHPNVFAGEESFYGLLPLLEECRLLVKNHDLNGWLRCGETNEWAKLPEALPPEFLPSEERCFVCESTNHSHSSLGDVKFCPIYNIGR